MCSVCKSCATTCTRVSSPQSEISLLRLFSATSCSDYIAQTAVSLRALQLYAPKADKAAYDQAIQLAAAWIAKAQSTNNEDRSARVLGLAWAGKDKDATQKALRELIAKQRPDGGWSDLDSMESLSLIHISEPTRLLSISYAVF